MFNQTKEQMYLSASEDIQLDAATEITAVEFDSVDFTEIEADNCFGTAGTLGTLSGCFGTFGTYGCSIAMA